MNAMPAEPGAAANEPATPGPLSGIDPTRLEHELETHGWALLPGLLGPETCRSLAALYDAGRFRSSVVMARHNFGRGEYRYFEYPLPEPLASLRPALYALLLPLARRWHEAMGLATALPDSHADYLADCHAAGQTRPTPLLLRYGPGDYNCLHQDLYGEHVFPLQVACLLSAPGRDFSGGELVLTEQRPRMQSRATVVPLQQGDGVAFAVNDRPVPGKRGTYRVKMRHGVSPVLRGERHVLGIIFHDAT